MRLSSSIIALTTLIATTSAALGLQNRDTVPSVNILSYRFPNCSTTSPYGVRHGPTHQIVPVNNCTVIGKTLSFRVSPPTPCPDGYRPSVLIFHSHNCTGGAVVENYLDPIDDTCVEDDEVGRSAFFECTDS